MKGDDLEDAVVGRFDIIFVPRSTLGNISVFATQFLGPASNLLSSSLVGWELFNLDRVFVTRVVLHVVPPSALVMYETSTSRLPE